MENLKTSAHWFYRGLAITVITAALTEEAHCSTTIDPEPASNHEVVAAAERPLPAVYGFSLLGDQGKKEKKPCPEEPIDLKCRNFSTHLDFLYWKAYEDGLEYGTKILATPLIGAASTTKSKLLDLHFQWAPGFTAGFGYAFDSFDCWELDLNWTRIRNRAHASMRAAGFESQVGRVDTIVSPWVNLLFSLRGGAYNAIAKWRMTLNTVDLDFGRKIQFSKALSLKPKFGMRGAWIDQKYTAKYQSFFLESESAPPFPRDVNFKARNNFSALGVRGGGELVCYLSKNWHLFSDLFATLLYGKFRVSMTTLNDQGLGEGSIPPSPINYYTTEQFWRVRLNFEEAIGLGWETFFKCDSYRLRARASYELSQWLHQNQLFYTFYFRGDDTISTVPIRNQGDLSFQGVRVSLQLDY